jgi:hypothetical protein
MKQRWEYRVETFWQAPEAEGLNVWGQDGWQLVSLIQMPGHPLRAYFKREVVEVAP